jgi:hypothetical protein
MFAVKQNEVASEESIVSMRTCGRYKAAIASKSSGDLPVPMPMSLSSLGLSPLIHVAEST